PVQCRYMTQPRCQPGINHILVPSHPTAARATRVDIGPTDNLLIALVAVPNRDPMSPPQLPRDVPVANILQPVDVHRPPSLWQDANRTVAHCFERWLRERLHLHEPLIRQSRLD